MRAVELFHKLHALDLLKESPPLWWPNFGTFEVVVGAILTQQTQWKNVEKSLQNLVTLNLTTPYEISSSPQWIIAQAITPSGFYNMKAKRLIELCHAIVEKYETFKVFQEDVTREWLLKCSGIGMESADAILCYACAKDTMVIDRYTARLLQALEVFDEDELQYEAMQEWIMSGIESEWEKLSAAYGYDSLYALYADFHGMIVEYCKQHIQKSGCCVKKLREEL